MSKKHIIVDEMYPFYILDDEYYTDSCLREIPDELVAEYEKVVDDLARLSKQLEAILRRSKDHLA